MYNMLIVDDNPVDRRGIQNIVDWSNLGINIIGSCANGRQALIKVKEFAESGQNKVDIIITDVAMPVMNGIKMAKELKNTYPEIKFIFMSCYNDFEFAKSAIDLDAYGYVLKPIVVKELIETVSKLLNEFEINNASIKEKEKMLRQLKEMLPLVQEQFLKELLLGNFYNVIDIKSRTEFLKLQLPEDCDIYVISLTVNNSENKLPEINIAEKYMVSFTIKEVLQSLCNSYRTIYPVQISGEEFASIIFMKNKAESDTNSAKSHNIKLEVDIIESAVDIYSEVSSRVKLLVTLGVSKSSNALIDIPELYRQSIGSVNTSFYSAGNPIIFYKEIEDKQNALFEHKINLEVLYNEIKALVNYGDEKKLEEFIDKYLNSENTLLPESYIKSLTFSIVNMTAIILIEAGQSFKEIFNDDVMVWEKLSKFETIVNIRQWIYNLFRAIREQLNTKIDSQSTKTVDTIKQIIKERYNEQITVEDITKTIYLSSRYANSIFKKETGNTIFDYLLEYRIEVAKKLLRNPNSRISAVSESVGYENKSFFSLIFKKYVGLTPTEYKNKEAF